MSQIKQVLILRNQGKGRKTIARILSISKTTVKAIYERLDQLTQSGHSMKKLLELPDPELESKLYSGNPSYKENLRYDYLRNKFSYYQKELTRTGVTRQLLWQEYQQHQPNGYSYSQFCYHLQQLSEVAKPSLKLTHQPGDKLYVDFAGKQLHYIDRQTGEVIYCQVFVACLPYSDYSFALAVPDQRVGSLIYALTQCLQHLAGVPASIVTDNLKSSVVKSDRYEPSINQAMEDFANHYQTAIIPTRTYKPKDKALVENQVRLIYQRVYAKFRDQRFFDLESLNKAIAEKVLIHNQTRMQQRAYCRQEHFLAKEQPTLRALPNQAYELKRYKRLRVAKNNHIYLSDDKHYYSVPYQYIGQMANLLYTRTMVYIYCQNVKVATHIRNYQLGGYSTQKDHLCSHHKAYLDRSPSYYKSRAYALDQRIGTWVDHLFNQEKHPEQLYKTCEGVLSLYKRAENQQKILQAIQIALDHQQFSYRFILNLINNKMINQQSNDDQRSTQPLPEHTNVRGKQYYQSLLNFNTHESH